MAAGTTRAYVHVESALTFDRYLDGLRTGRSFVTTGQGSMISQKPGADVPWQLAVTSPTAVDTVEYS
jgi:hypothetical protein